MTAAYPGLPLPEQISAVNYRCSRVIITGSRNDNGCDPGIDHCLRNNHWLLRDNHLLLRDNNLLRNNHCLRNHHLRSCNNCRGHDIRCSNQRPDDIDPIGDN